MSMWIFFERGEKASRRPVMRSSKRAPTQTITSQSCMAEVGFVGAVHAEHAEPLLVGGGIGAEPHQRRRDGEAGEAHELAQELARLGARVDDAAAGIEERLLGGGHELDGFAHGRLVGLHLRLVGLMRDVRRPDVVAGRELDVLRDVDDDRPRPAGLGDVERLVQDAREVVDVLHQPIVLRARARDADRVALLESVVADQVRRHLPGDADDAELNP